MDSEPNHHITGWCLIGVPQTEGNLITSLNQGDLVHRFTFAGSVQRYPPEPGAGIVNLEVDFYFDPDDPNSSPRIQNPDTGQIQRIDGSQPWTSMNGGQPRLLLGRYRIEKAVACAENDWGDGTKSAYAFPGGFGKKDVHPPPFGAAPVSHVYRHTGDFQITATEGWEVGVIDPVTNALILDLAFTVTTNPPMPLTVLQAELVPVG